MTEQKFIIHDITVKINKNKKKIQIFYSTIEKAMQVMLSLLCTCNT